jgi:transcriptional regulator with XRE-family HTH domain
LAEIENLQFLQKSIADAVDDYVQKNKIGFNELVRRLNSSPAHVSKIQRGEANLTLSSIAHLFSLLGKEPQLIFKSKK